VIARNISERGRRWEARPPPPAPRPPPPPPPLRCPTLSAPYCSHVLHALARDARCRREPVFIPPAMLASILGVRRARR